MPPTPTTIASNRPALRSRPEGVCVASPPLRAYAPWGGSLASTGNKGRVMQHKHRLRVSRGDGDAGLPQTPRGFDVHRHRLRIDDDAVVPLGELDRREPVEDVSEHELRVALERV